MACRFNYFSLNMWMNEYCFLSSTPNPNTYSLIQKGDLNPKDFIDVVVPKPVFLETHHYCIPMAILILNATIYERRQSFWHFNLFNLLWINVKILRTLLHLLPQSPPHQTAPSKGTSAEAEQNWNKIATVESTIATFQNLLPLSTSENRYFHKALGFFQIVSVGEWQQRTAIICKWLVS